jgi:hypothetical protein
VEVESTIRPAKDRIAGFEGREGHRTIFASIARIAAKQRSYWKQEMPSVATTIANATGVSIDILEKALRGGSGGGQWRRNNRKMELAALGVDVELELASALL